MNKILTLAAALAVGSASLAVYAQSDTGAPGEAYGKFRPLAGQQGAAAEQPAAQPAQAPEAPMQPERPPQPAVAAVQAPAQVQPQPPMMGAPYGYGPGPGFGPGAGHMDPYGAQSWARYEERKRLMRDRHMYQRYAGPRRGYGRHSRFAPPFGGPAPYHGGPQGPAAVAPEAGQAPEAAAAQPGGY